MALSLSDAIEAAHMGLTMAWRNRATK